VGWLLGAGGGREQDESGGAARYSGPQMCTVRADKTKQIFVSAVTKDINVISGPVKRYSLRSKLKVALPFFSSSILLYI
jgi:hypothetical protein